MKKCLILLVLVILPLASCSPWEGSSESGTVVSEPIIIHDALDRSVSLPSAPQRIVISGKGLFMIADAVYMFPEASSRIVGLGNAGQGTSNFIFLIDPLYEEKTILEKDAGAEQIAGLRPDLVLLKSSQSETLGVSIETIGIPVIYVDFERPEQFARDIVILGQVFQDETRAQEITAFFQSRMEQIQQVVRGVDDKPTSLLLYHSDNGGSVVFYIPPLAWMQTLIVQMAGGDPVWIDAALGNSWMQVTLEQIAVWDADEIFIVSYDTDSSEVVAALEANPTWQALRAVREGHLHGFPADLYSWDQPDTRWILGLTWLAGRLHPELYPHQDVIEEARVFYQSLYGLDEAFFEMNILPTFKGDLP